MKTYLEQEELKEKLKEENDIPCMTLTFNNNMIRLTNLEKEYLFNEIINIVNNITHKKRLAVLNNLKDNKTFKKIINELEQN